MQFTTVRSNGKRKTGYDETNLFGSIPKVTEKLDQKIVVHSQQEHEKNVSQSTMFPSYLEVEKTGSQLFRA